ncbi:MAG: hypothetical protein ACAH11_05805 [Sphingomonas sp.]
MRHWALSAAIGAAILISSSGAASPTQGLISGSYVLDPERSDDAVQAIDSGLAGPSSATRLPFARRLRKAAAPAYAVRISIAAGRFSIKRDAHPLITLRIGGEPIQLWLESGERFDVSARADGDAISLTFRADNSERTTVYRSVGQQLVTETVITSPLLSAPIRYKLVYNRAS